jgi:acyl-CoA synthetase (AMP-forming)/AMP-acid ligase II
VVGLPDDKWGQRITAVAVKRSGSIVSEADVIQGLRGTLAGYKLPKQVIFVDMLPRNAGGKVLKRELRKTYR